MHRCLRVPEIILMIFQELNRGSSFDYEHSPRGYLRAAALTCRDWFPPSVEYLWYNIVEIEPILDTLPDDLWEIDEQDSKKGSRGGPKTRALLRDIRETDLLRFKTHYAHRIHKFQLKNPWPYIDILRNLEAAVGAVPLLPRVQIVVWSTSKDSIDFDLPLLARFTGTSIKHLTLRPQVFSTKSIQSNLDLLFTKFSHLTHLEIAGNLLVKNPQASKMFIEVPNRWAHCLKSLTLDSLTNVELDALSAMPHLTILNLRRLGPLERLYLSSQSPKYRPSSIAFPSLQSLTVATLQREEDAPSLQSILQYLSPTNTSLKSIFLKSYSTSDVGQWQQLISLIITHCDHRSLTGLHFGDDTDDPGHQYPGDHRGLNLSPLAVFRNLTTFGYYVAHAKYISRAELDLFVDAWKDLRVLDIGFHDETCYQVLLDYCDMLFVVRSIPNLIVLRISLELDNLPPSQARLPPPPETALYELEIANSEIEDLHEFLLFLTMHFKPLPCLIHQMYFGEDELNIWEAAVDRVNRIRNGEAAIDVINESYDSDASSHSGSESGYSADGIDEDDWGDLL